MKRLLSMLLVISLSIVFSGCSDKTDEEENLQDKREIIEDEKEPDVPHLAEENSWEITFYCLDKSTDLLVPIIVDYPKQEGIAAATVEQLVLGSDLSSKIADYGLEPPLPQRTQVLGISINNGLARVDLNEEILEFRNDRHEVMGITSLVYTLTQFQTIEQVQLVVDGEIIQTLVYDTYVKAPMGKDIGINISVSDGVDLKDNMQIINYFPVNREGEIFYIPETKAINKTENVLMATIEEFFKGPNTNLLVNNIPEGVKVLDANLEEDIAYVNLSREFSLIKEGYEKAVIDALILTLVEIDEVNRVKITVDGKAEVLSEGTDLSETFVLPKFPKLP